ncbi:MAG TPA: TonB family protein [Candidatus Binataceae bacterium]|nr:TonB family protein [Candidatus Binataceae bacterium]
MAAPVIRGDDKASRWGYVGAILLSALGHAAFFFLILVVLPGFFSSKPPPPSYTVQVVDSIPAGDLGTHLPRLSQDNHRPKPPKPTVRREEPKPTPAATPAPPDNDKNAIALNSTHSPTPTPTPTPTPPPPEPTAAPTPKPKRRERPRPTPQPTPKRIEHRRPHATPTARSARATPKPTPDLKEEIAKLHNRLMAEHLEKLQQAKTDKNAKAPHNGGGPVLASTETEGKGYGVGSGTGSAGIQQSAEFLLYYQAVQKKIKDAWSFAGNNPDLTATVTFGINPDGSLAAATVTGSSRDPSFDDSVVRAIRRAAPFPPPPEKYRDQFADGVPAIFKLGTLKGDDDSGG